MDHNKEEDKKKPRVVSKSFTHLFSTENIWKNPIIDSESSEKLFPYPIPESKASTTDTATLINRIRRGLNFLINGLLEKCSREQRDEDIDSLSKDVANLMDTFMNREISEESIHEYKTLQDKFQLTNNTMKRFCEEAHSLFEVERYHDAADSFFVLTLLNPLSYEYWLSLGVCEQKAYNYDSALKAYSMASLLNLEEPVPHLYASQCLYNMNKHALASIAIELANTLTKGNTEHPYKEQINKFRARLTDF